jgi:hypothetical protein
MVSRQFYDVTFVFQANIEILPCNWAMVFLAGDMLAHPSS